MYNKTNLDVLKLAAKDDTRPAINGILFTGRKTVATNSFALVEVDGLDGEEVHSPVILSRDTLKNIKITNKDTFDIGGRKGTPSIVVAGKGQYLTQQVQEEFPAYESILPTGEPVVELQVNVDYLISVLQVMKSANGKEENKVRLAIHDKDSRQVLEVTNIARAMSPHKQKARAIIMPMMDTYKFNSPIK
jgi:DNA polymerase III sliding clamp (beta) subunit (PCNA family)